MDNATFNKATHVQIEGKTPLMWAAALGKLELLEKLIKAGADVNLTQNGVTALYHAYAQRQLDAALVLISKGADVNAGDPKPISTINEGDRTNSTAHAMRNLYIFVKSKEAVSRGNVINNDNSAPRASNSALLAFTPALVASNSTPDPAALEVGGGRRRIRTRRNKRSRSRSSGPYRGKDRSRSRKSRRS